MEAITLFGLFVALTIFYHFTEFFVHLYYNPNETGLDSFLVTREYCMAMVCCVLEYWIEYLVVPGLKTYTIVTGVGLVLLLFGDGLRKLAMITAKGGFTHKIQTTLRTNHTLVDWGVYRYIRHPGYLGWLVWSVGGQMMLLNPICTVGFAYVSWRFFQERIPYEETILFALFGRQYEDYRRRTPTWIPFIGYD